MECLTHHPCGMTDAEYFNISYLIFKVCTLCIKVAPCVSCPSQLFFVSIVYSKGILYSIFSVYGDLFCVCTFPFCLYRFLYFLNVCFVLFWFSVLLCFKSLIYIWSLSLSSLSLPFSPPLPLPVLFPLCPYSCIKISIKQLSSSSLILPALCSEFTSLHRISIFP